MNGTAIKFIFFVVLVGAAYLSWAFMIKPANKALEEQKAAMTARLGKLAELQRATAAARDLDKQLEQLEQAVKFFESKLPPESEIHKVLEQITLIAQSRHLRPKSISALKTQKSSGYIEQPLKMELQGSFDSYYSFLLDLEKLPRITKIRELELKKSIEQEGQTEAQFIVSIFFQDNVG